MNTRRLSVLNYGPGKLILRHERASGRDVFTVLVGRAQVDLTQQNLPVVISSPGPRLELHGLLVLNSTEPAVRVHHVGPAARVIKRDDSVGKPPTTTRGTLLRWRKVTVIPGRSEAGFARGNLPMRIE